MPRLECRQCKRVVERVAPVDDATKLRCRHCGARDPLVSVKERVVPYQKGYVPNRWRE